MFCMAQKPIFEKNYAQNVMKHGTGGININGCKVPIVEGIDDSRVRTMNRSRREQDINEQKWGVTKQKSDTPQVVSPSGRFPANLIHDGSDEVVGLFSETKSGKMKQLIKGGSFNVFGKQYPRHVETIGDSGSAARFFYCAKASPKERNEGLNNCEVKNNMRVNAPRNSEEDKFKTKHGNCHPTVKPKKTYGLSLSVNMSTKRYSFRPIYG